MSSDLNCTIEDGWAGESTKFGLASDTALTGVVSTQYGTADANKDNLLTGTELTGFFTATYNAVGLGTPTTAEQTTWATSTASPMVTNLANIQTAILAQIHTKITAGYPANKAGTILTFFNNFPNLEYFFFVLNKIRLKYKSVFVPCYFCKSNYAVGTDGICVSFTNDANCRTLSGNKFSG
jgi:hypothetical protein